MVKRKAEKRKLQQEEIEESNSETEVPSKKRFSDDPIPKKTKWTNRQRVLIFAARGITFRDRHLMNDLRTLMAHSKQENKLERKEQLFVINEICEMKNCNKCIFFEARMKRDLYMWVANTPSGPSAKFLVENVYTMAELKLTGNCLKGSRPLLSFDENFTKFGHYRLLKELFIQIFGTPYYHPKSQPFIDHVITFSVLDNRIWFRNYQILSEDGALSEIGPRFVLNPIKIFDGSFGGNALWENQHYVTPALYRRQLKKACENKYNERVDRKVHRFISKPEKTYELNPVDEIFAGDPLEKASEIQNTETTYQEFFKKEDGKPPKEFKKKKKQSVNSKIHGNKNMKFANKKQKKGKKGTRFHKQRVSLRRNVNFIPVNGVRF